MPRLTQLDRERAIRLHQSGYPNVRIAERLGCSRQTIQNLLAALKASVTPNESAEPKDTTNK